MQAQRGLPHRARRMVMLPGRQKPIWPRAAWIAALAWAALGVWCWHRLSVARIPQIPAAAGLRGPACLPRAVPVNVYA